MIDIRLYLPGKKKSTPSGWISFNCPCCQEKRSRGGIKLNDQGWSYHCFNCGYTCSSIQGRAITAKAKNFLDKLGVPEQEIERWNLESLKHRNIHGILDDRIRLINQLSDIEFKEHDEFPPCSEPITQDHKQHWDYLVSRKVPMDYPYLTATVNDGIHWVRPHITIPFTYEDKIVGWCARFLDNRSPKYINHTQPGYVFGVDLQKPQWQYALVVEGIFDALSINGLAVMHNSISDRQVRVIRNLGRSIIVVPDQDLSGMDLVDRAMELGWAVSMPEWPDDVKDVNDAVVKFGKLKTLLTIIESRESSRIKIELRKKQIVKRIRH